MNRDGHVHVVAESTTERDQMTTAAGAELKQWWIERAAREAEQVTVKARTYGSNSLIQLGRKMAQLQGREVGDGEAIELGCWAYTVGKIERWTDAVMRGERPHTDSILDAHIYCLMVVRTRETGRWP